MLQLAERLSLSAGRNQKPPASVRLRPSPINSASPALDVLSFKFAMFAARSVAPCLDVGCGSGVATRAALARGAQLIAVDPDPDNLQQLLTQLPVNQFGNVSVHCARLEEVSLAAGRLAGAHISRVLQHLDGEAVRKGLSDMARWLQPGGKLFLSALTPDGSFWKEFSAEFSRRAMLGDCWPGYIRDVTRYDNRCPPGMNCHLLSEAVLTRELRALDFEIEEVMTYSLAWDSTQTCCAVIARRPVSADLRG